jgi:hypothetical protein
MIPIDISVKPGVVENILIGVDFSPQEIELYNTLFKEFHDISLGAMRRCQAWILGFSNMI